jgi:hypothetical protein
MSKKSKKTKKKSKKARPQRDPFDQAWDIGWEAEATMAKAICDSIPKDNEHIDDAFFAALSGLVERMQRFYSRSVILDHIANMPESQEPSDCQEVHGDASVVMAEADKSKVH